MAVVVFVTPIYRGQRVRFRMAHGRAKIGTLGVIHELGRQLTVGFAQQDSTCDAIEYLELEIALKVLEFEIHLGDVR